MRIFVGPSSFGLPLAAFFIRSTCAQEWLRTRMNLLDLPQLMGDGLAEAGVNFTSTDGHESSGDNEVEDQLASTLEQSKHVDGEEAG